MNSKARDMTSFTKLNKSYGSKRLENACSRVLVLGSSPTIRNITVLIKSGSDRASANTESGTEHKGHGITRGAAYYGRGGKH